MARIVVRVVGALLALVGLALTVVGVWFAVQLGGAGTATFTVRPEAGQVVVVPPEVLNRVDADVEITATPADGDRVWMALANPSDAEAVIGDARHVEVTGVDIRDWVLRTTTRGTGEAPTLGNADLWRQQDDAKEPVRLTVEQSQAPETVVVHGLEGGDVQSLTLRISDKRWFVEAVVGALVGLFLLIAGVVAMWPRRRRSTAPPAPDGTPAAASEGAADPGPGRDRDDGTDRDEAAETGGNPQHDRPDETEEVTR